MASFLCAVFISLVAAASAATTVPVTALPKASVTVVGSAVQTYDGQYFTIRITNSQPQAGDILGLYTSPVPALSPAANIASQTAIKYWFPAAMDATYLKTKTTKMSIVLPNYRASTVLYLFGSVTLSNVTGGFLLPSALIASSPVIVNKKPEELTQGHLSYRETNRTHAVVAVQWTTKSVNGPVAYWGFSGQSVTTGPFKGLTQTYNRSEMCAPPASTTGWREPGTLNFAFITVPLGRKIYYKFGTTVNKMMSPVYAFTTPPPPSPTAAIRFLWMADYGNASPDGGEQFGIDSSTLVYAAPPSPGNMLNPANAQYAVQQASFSVSGIQNAQGSALVTARALTKEVAAAEKAGTPYHALFINGDISYARGYQVQWDHFWMQTTPISHSVPIMVALGNHERDALLSGDRFQTSPPLDIDSGGECGIPALRRFIHPAPWTPKDLSPAVHPDSAWYSFNIGPVHFLQYSSEHDVSPNSAQWLFVRDDLATLNRTATPWVIVGGHRPMHIDSLDGILPTSNLLVGEKTLNAFEDLFFQYEVDLVLHGHHHSYQRTKPVYKRNPTPGAPVYVVAGNAGYQLTLIVQPTMPDFFQKVQFVHGYLRFSASTTSLSYDFVATNGTVMETYSLSKPAGYKPTPAARLATISAQSSMSDQYATKLLTTYSFAYLAHYGAAYLLPNLNAKTVALSLQGLAAASVTEFASVYTTSIEAPDVAFTDFAAADWVYNYMYPTIVKMNATIAADKQFQFYLSTYQKMLARVKAMLN